MIIRTLNDDLFNIQEERKSFLTTNTRPKLRPSRWNPADRYTHHHNPLPPPIQRCIVTGAHRKLWKVVTELLAES